MWKRVLEVNLIVGWVLCLSLRKCYLISDLSSRIGVVVILSAFLVVRILHILKEE